MIIFPSISTHLQTSPDIRGIISKALLTGTQTAKRFFEPFEDAIKLSSENKQKGDINKREVQNLLFRRAHEPRWKSFRYLFDSKKFIRLLFVQNVRIQMKARPKEGSPWEVPWDSQVENDQEACWNFKERLSQPSVKLQIWKIFNENPVWTVPPCYLNFKLLS